MRTLPALLLALALPAAGAPLPSYQLEIRDGHFTPPSLAVP
ncbi:MAG: cupredoxin domain-containing protein, partial [Aquipseudomonas alcaligenes]